MQIWGLSDAGCVRSQNQDAYVIAPLAHERALIVVCDGMGGAKSGNVASALAAEVFSEHVKRNYKQMTNAEKSFQVLDEALRLANEAVFEKAQSGEDFEGMGTTLVAAYIHKNDVFIINVGDSRAYSFTENGITAVTTDHSIAQMMVQRGELTSETAKSFPGKNYITRAVGTERETAGDHYALELQKDDSLLLCSDGLSNQMADQEILFEVAHGAHKNDCCQRLLEIAKNRGAPDNVTVVLAAF